MIGPVEFEQEMDRLRPEFPSWKLTPAKSQMVWAAARALPRESLTKVVTHMIASFRRPPTVQDFIDALASDARVYAARTPVEPFKAECWRCKDAGMLMASSEDIDTLCLCDCERGRALPWKLPRRDELGTKFRFDELLPELFKPNAPEQSTPRDNDELNRAERRTGGAITQKAAWWREMVRIHEEAWKQFLTTHD